MLIGIHWEEETKRAYFWQFEEDDKESWLLADSVSFDEHLHNWTGPRPPAWVIKMFHYYILNYSNHSIH